MKKTKITIEITCSEPPHMTNEADDLRAWVIEQLGLNTIETALEFDVDVNIVAASDDSLN